MVLRKVVVWCCAPGECCVMGMVMCRVMCGVLESVVMWCGVLCCGAECGVLGNGVWCCFFVSVL